MKIALAFLGGIERCPRARRLANGLAQDQLVLISDLGGDLVVEHASPSFCSRAINLVALLLGFFEFYLRRRYRLNKTICADVLVCHDLLLLPLVVRMIGHTRCVVDLREYYPEQFAHSILWKLTSGRLARYICRTYLSRADRLVTVSQGLARLYERDYGRSVNVIYSYADFLELPVQRTNNVVRLVHHGNATANRNLENMIDMMNLLDNKYELHLYLVEKEPSYFARLVDKCSNNKQVTLHPVVHPADLVRELNQYDVGLFVPPRSTVNLDHSMPNKLFEFIQARLMVMVTPLSDVSDFVRATGVGRVVKGANAEELASAVAELTEKQIQSCKIRANQLALEMNSQKFCAQFEQLMKPNEA